MAPPLSLMAGKSGRMSGLAIGFVVIASYYGLLLLFEGIVRSEIVPHYLGAWVPSALFIFIAYRMFKKEAAR